MDKLEKVGSSSPSSSSPIYSTVRDGAVNPRAEFNSKNEDSADSSYIPRPGCQDSPISGQSRPTQTATQSSKFEKEKYKCHVQGCINLNISPLQSRDKVLGAEERVSFNYDESADGAESGDGAIEDGQIVETLLVPVYIKHDNSPTSLRSDSDKDSGISLQSTHILSSKDSCFLGFVKGESDNTDASEFSDEDLERKENSLRPKSPFERRIWNRQNGRFKVRKALIQYSSRPSSPDQVRGDSSPYSQSPSRCSSPCFQRQMRRAFSEPSPEDHDGGSPPSSPVNQSPTSSQSRRVLSPIQNQTYRGSAPLSPELYRRNMCRPPSPNHHFREVPRPSPGGGDGGGSGEYSYTDKQYDLKSEIAKMRQEVASMREEADFLDEEGTRDQEVQKHGERTDDETDEEVEEDSFQESVEEFSSFSDLSDTEAGDWEYSSDENDTSES